MLRTMLADSEMSELRTSMGYDACSLNYMVSRRETSVSD